jgi:hypothetical protein
MPLFGLILVLQIVCVVHVIRTGRNQIWIYVIIFLPAAGCLAYLAAEILPELFGSRTARQMRSGARRMVDPTRDLRQATDDLALADTVENRRAYAAACLSHGRAEEAIRALEEALAGVHESDPSLLFDLARATFAGGAFQRTLDLLDRLQQADPGYTSTDAHLLYARALEELGRAAEAIQEYRALIGYFSGEEARCRLAMLLERQGDRAGAKALFAEILERQRRAPRYYRKSQGEWVAVARDRLKALEAAGR